jgi:hypothetical protein
LVQQIAAQGRQDTSTMIRLILTTTIMVGVFSTAFAQNAADRGTPEQRAACGPAVRKYCYMLKPDDDVFAYQRCLEANRDKIGQKCQLVLEGQPRERD